MSVEIVGKEIGLALFADTCDATCAEVFHSSFAQAKRLTTRLEDCHCYRSRVRLR